MQVLSKLLLTQHHQQKILKVCQHITILSNGGEHLIDIIRASSWANRVNILPNLRQCQNVNPVPKEGGSARREIFISDMHHITVCRLKGGWICNKELLHGNQHIKVSPYEINNLLYFEILQVSWPYVNKNKLCTILAAMWEFSKVLLPLNLTVQSAHVLTS